MNQPLRTTSAVSIVILSSMIAGCAAPSAHMGAATHFGGKADGDVGLASRALAALNSNNVPLAIQLAERAVAKSPNDAGFRALLGNAYFAGGRFRSAEGAYRDSLSLTATQPQVILKLALVQIAQGKNDDAKGLLAQAQSVLDPADTGLALALAGDPQSAIAVLEPAARAVGADSRVRQNLALAYAFAGDWGQARVVAAQDVPGDQLDGRIQQWMALAKPARSSDQVAAFIGIQPAAADPGQPIRLALNKDDATRQAAAQPIEAPQAPAAEPAAVATVELPPAPVAEPVAVAVAEPIPTPLPEPVAEPRGGPGASSGCALRGRGAGRPDRRPAAARRSRPGRAGRASCARPRAGLGRRREGTPRPRRAWPISRKRPSSAAEPALSCHSSSSRFPEAGWLADGGRHGHTAIISAQRRGRVRSGDPARTPPAGPPRPSRKGGGRKKARF